MVAEKQKPIYAIRTTVGREKGVADTIAKRAQVHSLKVKSVVIPGELRGYVMIEGDRDDVAQAVYGVAHARGVIRGFMDISEIDHYLSPKPVVKDLEKGYLVEVISGPFKGEKAKVTRVDKEKGEIIIELLEATVPIPITVNVDSVRVLEKEETGE
jgi:transcriptional antiterminator NusG